MRPAMHPTAPVRFRLRQESALGALALLVAGLVVGGCGGGDAMMARGAITDHAGRGSAPQAAAPNARAQSVGEAPAAPGTSGVRTVAAIPRKIIYTAEVELVVERLSRAADDLARLVKDHGGYLAEADTGGTPGAPRTGRWKARVPVERFEAFMSALTRMGEVQRVHTGSQDVTEEYFDVDARLSSKRVEEQRLLQHLQRSTARLQDILSVERELGRVREEIERLQGRMRLLTNQTDLTTVTVTLNEVSGYTPPRSTSFAAQVGRTFHTSIDAMAEAAKGMVLVAVALAPWLLVLLLIAVPAVLLARRYGTRSQGSGAR